MHTRKKTSESHDLGGLSLQECKEDKDAKTVVEGGTSSDKQKPPVFLLYGGFYTIITFNSGHR